MRAFGGFQESGINASSPNTWAATHRWNVSWSQFPHCVIRSPEIHASLRKFLLSPRSLWDSSLPPRSPFAVECHQCSDDHMLLCDQKTFLTHSVGLQINSSPEKPRRKISLEKNLDIQILEEGLFCLISEQLNLPNTQRRLWSYRMDKLWGQLSAGWLTSFKHIGSVSTLSGPGTTSGKASH